MTRKTLVSYGPSRATVRVFTEGDLVRVQWREGGRLLTKSWGNTPANRTEAKAWAKGFAESRELRRVGASARLTMRELWDRYTAAEFPLLRENTKRLYGEAWKRWEFMMGARTVAEDANVESLAAFRRELEGKFKLAVNTVRMAVRAVKTVYAFGQRTEIIARNRIEAYRFKVAKEKRPVAPAEFTPEEFGKILAALDPTKGTQWRAHVALALCGYQGARQHAVLHLQWSDIDLEAGRITWRAEWDKMGNRWEQPIRDGARKVLEHAWRWRAQLGYNGPWVIPAPRAKTDAPYDKQTLWWNLKEASKRAGVAKLRWRAGHGFRRMLATDVHELTGDPILAMRSIGDTDIRQAETYIKTRDGSVAKAFARLDESDRNESAIHDSEKAAKSLD